MAYIKPEEVKNIRQELKKAFPNIKFSVRTQNYSTVVVDILESDIDFSEVLEDREYRSINTYGEVSSYDEEFNKIFNSIISIMKGQGWYDKSDIMTDYFNTAYYMNLSVGRWDKPFKFIGEKVAA